jgi:hypothetical protein
MLESLSNNLDLSTWKSSLYHLWQLLQNIRRNLAQKHGSYYIPVSSHLQLAAMSLSQNHCISKEKKLIILIATVLYMCLRSWGI